jgi:gliding motility-associated-like protein
MNGKIYAFLIAFSLTWSMNSFAQFASTPCASGPLPNACANNTVNLTSAFTNSGVPNPSAVNGVGCNSVGSNITAGQIGGPFNSQPYDGWFTTTASAAGVVDVYAAIVTGDPVVGIYSGTCGSLTLLTCDDDGGTGLDANATATGLTPGATYWVRVWDYNGGTGTYTITSNGGTPPSNDLCSGATSLTPNAAPIGGTNYCATVSSGDWNDCENLTENNVWYSFTIAQQGDITVNFSSIACFGSGQGIDVSVFYGNCSSFSSYGCTSVNAGATGSIPTFTGPAGTYYVMVDGNNSGGTTALCTFNVDVDVVGCPADAGTNTSPALITACAGTNYNASATGTVDTNLGSNPCIGWGYWVASDPLNIYPGMSGIGNLPTGNNPAGSGGDPNYIGVWPSTTYPDANGNNPTLPAEGNGVTYYMAPITLSNCATGEITTNCFDIGNVTQVYNNPAINTGYVIDCDVAATPTTLVALAVAGGLPSVNGSTFTLTNLGAGTLSATTVANNGTVLITGIPNNGIVNILITDGSGCTQSFTVGPIDAASYCPACGADAGDVNAQQTGTGVTQANNGVNGNPFVLCFGDAISLTHIGNYILPTDNVGLCGTPYGTAGACTPGIVYAILSGYSTTANPLDDLLFSTYGFLGEDQSFINDGNLINQLINSIPPINIVNNTIVLYPVTADATNIVLSGDPNTYWSEDLDGDECIDSGFPFSITFLNELNATILLACDGPRITVSGGYPEFFPGSYTVTNNGLGTITGLPVGHNGTFTITGLNNGDAYSVTIGDNNGCARTFTGTYNYTQPVLSINNLASSFCLNDPVDPFDVTPLPNNVTTGSFAINFVADGWGDTWDWIIEDNFGTTVAFGTITDASAPGTNLPTINVVGLNPVNGPFTFTITDDWGDGQDALGSTTITNTITGNVVASIAGNWGSSVTLNLGNFVSTTVTIGGTGVTDNGNGTATFNPTTVGTYNIGFVYDNGEGCTYTASQSVTVHQTPLLSSTIDPVICAGETILLSDYSPGEAFGVVGTGTWYVGTNSSGATAPTTAFVPVNGAQYYYEFVGTGGCRDGRGITVTVTPSPTVSFATVNNVCVNETITINPTTGGTWTSSNPAVATITDAGVITGVLAGTANMIFTDASTGCSSVAASGAVTVNPIPTVTVPGTGTVCVGQTITLSPTTGGTWATSDPLIATITNGGVVTGVLAGTANMTFTNTTTGCSSLAASGAITVNPLPTVTVPGSGEVCVGQTITLSPTTGGTWASSNTGIATITDAGVVTGVAAGTANMVFTNATTNCSSLAASGAVTVNPLPTVTVPGSGEVCVGQTITLSPTTGGTWASSNTGIATITDAGVVTGVAAGTANMVFTNTTTNCSSLAASGAVTVNPLPTVTVPGSGEVCVGQTITLSPTTGGTWASSNTGIATITDAGVVTGVAAGTANMVFTNATTNCSSLAASGAVTVNPLPTVTVPGSGEVCVGQTITLSPTTGGTWASSNTSIATITNGGVVTGVAAGTANMVFTNTTTNCSSLAASGAVTVNPLPTVTVPGSGEVCVGQTITLSPTTGGTWASSDPLIATITNGGVVTGVAAGTVNMVFTNTTTNCSSLAASGAVTVNPLPTVTVPGSGAVCVGQTITLSPTTGGTWTSSNTGIATITDAGVVTGVSAGTANMIFTDATTGCSSLAASGAITVNPLPTVTASANTPCVGQPLTLTGGTAGLTYSWTGPNTYASGSQSPTVSASATTAMAGTYTLLGSNGTCSNMASVVVTINALPVINVSGISIDNPTNCGDTDGGITGITATGAPVLIYSWNSSPTQNTVDLVDVGSGSYSLTVTDGNSCSTTAGPFTISDPTPPAQPTISLDAGPVCVGGSFTISVNSPDPSAIYTWSGPGVAANTTGTSLTVSSITAANSGNYTVTPTISGCTGNTSVAVNVIVNPLPIVDVLDPLQLNCVNTTITLDGSNSEQSASTTYVWNATNGGAILGTGLTDTETTSTPGDYELFVINSTTGCVNSELVTVTQNIDAPTADVSTTNGGVLDCSNSSLVLDGTNSTNAAGGTTGITYAWSTTSGGTSIGALPTLSVSAPGTYYLLVTQTASQCNDEVSITISADASVPTAIITNTANLTCSVTSINLDGSTSTGGTLDFEWFDSSSNSLGTNDNLTVTTPGQYTLTVFNPSNSCQNSTSVTISEDIAVPVVSIATPNDLTCTVTSVTLDGIGSASGVGIEYNWSTANGVIDGVTDELTAEVSSAGDYTFTVTNTSNGCSDNMIVTVNEDVVLPIADAGSDVNLTCASSSVMLDGSGSSGSGITYAWSGPGVVSGGNTDAPTVNQPGQYTLLITGSNGCAATSTVNVVPDANLPIANAGSAMTLDCNSTNVMLDGSGSDAGADIIYNWTTLGGNIVSGNGTNQIVVDAPGSYTLEVENTSNGCTSFASVNVTEDVTPPIASISTPDEINCLATTVVLDGSSSSGVGVSYLWSTADGNILTATNGSTITVDAAGTYSLVVTGANGCSDIEVVSVTEDVDLPTANATVSGSIDCINSEVILDGSSSSGDAITYNWTTINGNLIGSVDQVTATADGEGTYTLTVTSANGCTNSFDVVVTALLDLPTVTVAAPANLNCNNAIVSLDGSGSSGTGLTYNWSTLNGNIVSGDNAGIATVDAGGDYLLTVISDNGCSASVSVTVISIPTPIANFDATPTSGTIPLDVELINASVGSSLTYAWTFGNGTSSTDVEPTITYTTTGNFEIVLTVTDAEGCQDTATVMINVQGESFLIIPNIFSPNGDGENDIFKLVGSNIVEVKGVVMNRWGQVVYEWDAMEAGWDGRTVAGIEASEGTYYYIIDAVGADGKIYNHNGPFQLVR